MRTSRTPVHTCIRESAARRLRHDDPEAIQFAVTFDAQSIVLIRICALIRLRGHQPAPSAQLVMQGDGHFTCKMVVTSSCEAQGWRTGSPWFFNRAIRYDHECLQRASNRFAI